MNINKCPMCAGHGQHRISATWPNRGWETVICKVCSGTGSYDSSKRRRICPRCNGISEYYRKFRGEIHERKIRCGLCDGKGFVTNK